MGAAWYRARGELRRRWRSTLLLILLVGIAGGAVLTAVAGARRSSTAYERFREVTLASDMDMAFDGEPDPALIEAAYAQLRAMPQVAAFERADFPFIVPAGSGLYPYLDFLAYVSVDAAADPQVDLPRIIDGTLPEPGAADEMAITESYASETGLGVGDRAEFESYAWDQLEPLFTTGDAGPPAGPRMELEVTAIFDAPIFLSESSGDFQPRVFLTPAFVEEHGEGVATYPGGFTIRLHDSADVDDVTAELREVFGDEESLEITPATEIDRKIQSSVDVIVTALALCALVAAAAGALAVAQALVRHYASSESSDRWLSALGMTRWERVLARTATTVPVAVLGALLAVGLSVLASPLMPVGVARRAEPDPGLAVDLAVVLAGFSILVVAVVLLSVLAAAAVNRRERLATDAQMGSAPSRSMRALRRTSLEPPVTIGVAMAIEPRGGTTWAVRSALLGVVLGVIGLVAVAVFVSSVDELTSTSERYGSPFDALVSGFSGDVLEEGGDELLADPRVKAAGVGYGGLARIGGDEVNTYALESRKGDMHLPMLEGEEADGRGEVVLGSTTIDDAGVSIGDQVEIAGLGGDLSATVVGTAVFPVADERGSPGRGVLLGLEDFEAISSEEEINADVLIEWADGVDPEQANAELAAATETEVFAPRLPSDVKNLREVRSLPRALAAFLAVLAALAVIHALVTTVRLRRQELGVLRTLGFERRQLGRTLVWQATTIGVVGLVLGVPLGLVVGRVVWRAVAQDIGVVDDPVMPLLAVAVVVVGVLVILNLTAIVPSRSARSVSPAAVLRTG